jgi:hypothetical protein
MLSGSVDVTTHFPGGLLCRISNWLYAFELLLSNICVNTCLLLRAYVINNHNRLLLMVDVLFMLSLPAILLLFWIESTSTITIMKACIIIYPYYLSWIRFVIGMPINVISFTVFLYVVIIQYRTLSHECWQKVKSDGIIYLLGVVTAFTLASNWSELFFYFDCK